MCVCHVCMYVRINAGKTETGRHISDKRGKIKYSMMLHVHFKMKGSRVLATLIMYLETLHCGICDLSSFILCLQLY